MRLGFVALVAGTIVTAPAVAQQLTFVTGPQGGSLFQIGGTLKSMWEKSVAGLQIAQKPGAKISNVRAIDEDKADIGITDSIVTVIGIAGRPPYPKKLTKVCQLANLYSQYFQVVATAESKVNTLADLKGKALVTQPKGNTGELVTALVLNLNGLNYQSLSKLNFQAAYADAVALVKDGSAQVFTLAATAPVSAVTDLANARDVNLIPVDEATMAKVKDVNAGYNKMIIKAGTYPKQDRDVPVVGYSTHLVVACHLPESTVYQMVRTMAGNVAAMASTVDAIGGITPKDMALDIGVPLHKGAAQFYREAGAI